MRHRALLIVVATVAAVWPVLAGQTGVPGSATAADEARKHVDRFDAVDIPRIDALMKLASQHRLPLGIEYAGPELFAPVTLKFANTDTAAIIRTLFPASLGFRVSLDDAIPVIGHRTLPPRSLNALDVVLPRLVIPQMAPMQRAASQVWMTLARQLDPTIGGFAGSELGTPEARIPPMELVATTVRNALNRLVGADGNAVWFVTVPPRQLDRRWKKGDPPMWFAMQFDYNQPESIGRLIASRMPDIVPRDGRGSAAPVPQVAVTPFTPRKVKHVDPVYPSAAPVARTEQVVIAELRVNEEGRVADARILRSVPPLDQAALNAVRQWQYEPVLLNGSPTPFTISVVVNFTPSPAGPR
jgi:TonB family protein